jgi:hypothetical protein
MTRANSFSSSQYQRSQRSHTDPSGWTPINNGAFHLTALRTPHFFLSLFHLNSLFYSDASSL